MNSTHRRTVRSPWRSSPWYRALVLPVAAALLCGGTAQAANIVWTGATDNSWGTTTNWSPAGPPISSSTVFFNSSSTANLNTTVGATSYTITGISADSTLANDVSIAASGGTITLNGTGIAWWTGVTKNLSISAPLTVTGATQAWWVEPSRTVSISGNMTVSTNLLIRGNSAATGAGTYSFSGNVTDNNALNIGDGGYRGNMAVTAGNFDNSASASSLFVGQTSGTGTLAVSGGQFSAPNSQIMYLGNSSASGTLTTSGTGIVSVATSSSTIVVGRSNGTGVINLDGGTLLTSRSIRGSDFGAGNGTVNFNSGTLKAKDGNNANWLLSASTFNAFVKGSTSSNGAVFDTNGFDMGVPVALQHFSGGPAIDGGLTKQGAGILTLSAANTYTGNTSISGGTLKLAVGGSINNTPLIDVGTLTTFDVSSVPFNLLSGQKLQGVGTVDGGVAMNSGSLLAPGQSVGTLTFSSGTLNLSSIAASALLFELNTTGASDKVVFTGAGLLNVGTLNFNEFSFSTLGGFGPGVYTLFDTLGTITGTIGSANGTVGGYAATLSITGTNDVILTVVPEPSGFVMMLFGSVMLWLVRGKRYA